MKSLRVGVIGVGSMGRHHARIYSEMRGAELVGVSDSDEKTSKEVAGKFNVKSFPDYKSLLSEGLDAVSIAVPTTHHREVACDALDAGVHVLLEKPIADTVENAEAIIKKAKEKNCKLMIGHVERFNPIVPVIKSSIGKEKIITISITRVGPLPPRIKDVGVMIDLGVHDIDLIRHISGSEYQDIFPLVSSNIAEKEDAAIVSYRMRNGVLAQMNTDWLTPYKVREIEVSTKEKFIKGDFIDQKVTEYSKYREDGSYSVRELAVPKGEPLRFELSSFLASVRENKGPEVSGQDGLAALKVALSCLRKAGRE